MKTTFKLTLFSLTLATTQAWAQPVNPMDYYTPDTIDARTAQYIWDNQTTNVKNKDCYKRAHIWTSMMRDLYGRPVKAMKIFIHYTQKFNNLLDDIENQHRRYGNERTKDKYGNYVLNVQERWLYENNKTWDYHVAPLLDVEGQLTVFDKTLQLEYQMSHPYTAEDSVDPSYRFRLNTQMSTPEQWLDALSYRGEMLYQIKRKLIERYLEKVSEDSRPRRREIEKARELRAEYIAMGMDRNPTIDIKCEEVTSMAELDAKQDKGWCYYSIVPMYYWNEIDLRNLSYGYTSYNHAIPLPLSANTPEANAEGRDFIINEFNIIELELSKGEITSSRERREFRNMIKEMEEARGLR